jgi:hypothetical protein
MELKIEHLAPYLPYGLEIMFEYRSSFKCDPNYFKRLKLEGSNISIIGKKTYSIVSSKPILRPLSDLAKEIDFNGEKFVPKNVLKELIMKKGNYSNYDSSWINESIMIDLLPYWIIQKLLEWHFNVFNLPSNLFVNYNDLKQN